MAQPLLNKRVEGDVMASAKEPIGDLILRQALTDSNEFACSSPTVLSCGGIYIPHRQQEQRLIYHIITTSDNKEPVKVLTGAHPGNILHEVLHKESMN